MRAIFPLFGVAAVAALFVAMLYGNEPPAPLEVAGSTLVEEVAGKAGTDSADGDAKVCVRDCDEAVTPTAVPPGRPCPYCGQDGQRWTRLTSVPPPELLGTSAVLLEGSCGAVLYGMAWRDQRQPASLAKIATALVVAEHAVLSEAIEIEITGWDLVVENDSTIMGLQAGMRLTVEDLLYGLMLSSGNDAALELSRYLGGEAQMVVMMRERVAALGLTDTNLQNSHGLDAPGSYTTPFDMAILGGELLRNPLLRQMAATEFRPMAWHELGGLWNGNYLLYIYDDAIGVKTGYTEEAGWSIVSAADRDGRLLIASVFNSADVYWDSMRLFDWAYENTTSAC